MMSKTKKVTLIFLSSLMMISGFILIVSTLYQELVYEPEFPEDYHMQIPVGRYEWRSRNPILTWLGIGCLIASVLPLMLCLLKYPKKEVAKEE